MRPLYAFVSSSSSPLTVLALVLGFASLVLLCGCTGGTEEPAPEGRFVGPEISIELERVADGFKGRVVRGGEAYPLTAARTEEGASGQFEANGQRFDFSVVLEGERLRLQTGESVYVLDREVVANPLDARPNPLTAGGQDDASSDAKRAVAPVAEGSGSGAPAGTAAAKPDSAQAAAVSEGAEKVDAAAAKSLLARQAEAEARVQSAASFTAAYRHPVGFFFSYPEDWKLAPQAEGVLSLTPPDVDTSPAGPNELFLVIGDSADGMTDPANAEAVRAVEGVVGMILPFLRREGDVEKVPVQGYAGAGFSMAGKSPTGLDCAGKMYYAIIEGYAIGILAVSPKKVMPRRAGTVKEIFSTFGFKQPESDPRLVGTWRYEKTYISGEFSSVTVRNMVLRADGTCLEGGRMMVGMSHTDSEGNFTGSTSADSGQGADARGRWRAANKEISLEWEGGSSETWSYFVSGDDMLFKSGSSKKLWKRVR